MNAIAAKMRIYVETYQRRIAMAINRQRINITLKHRTPLLITVTAFIKMFSSMKK
jgi:hypothetical protein